MAKLKQNESGLAAIAVTMIIMGIVTLIVVGFATLMRREQRQALDQQLSTQAFYAAESGVNATRAYIDGLSSTDIQNLEDVNNCNDNKLADVYDQQNLGNGVSFSCVLLDVTPTSLEKNLSTEDSWTTILDSANGDNISKIEISWQKPTSTTFAESSLAAGHLLTPSNVWGDRTGIVRAMLMPYTEDRDQLINNTYQSFFYPNESNTTKNASDVANVLALPTAAQQGTFEDGDCNEGNTPNYCKVVLQVPGNQSRYYLRLKAIYHEASVTVRAYDGDNKPLELKGGQAKIDATGKSADVVRRIQVNVPLQTGFSAPEFALETFNTLCKRFYVWPDGAINDIASSNGTTTAKPSQISACDP